MTSLHVICDLPPPIKNPGYAYDWGGGGRNLVGDQFRLGGGPNHYLHSEDQNQKTAKNVLHRLKSRICPEN